MSMQSGRSDKELTAGVSHLIAADLDAPSSCELVKEAELQGHVGHGEKDWSLRTRRQLSAAWDPLSCEPHFRRARRLTIEAASDSAASSAHIRVLRNRATPDRHRVARFRTAACSPCRVRGESLADRRKGEVDRSRTHPRWEVASCHCSQARREALWERSAPDGLESLFPLSKRLVTQGGLPEIFETARG